MGLRRSFKPTNLVANGDFSKGTTGWSAVGAESVSVSDSVVTFTPNAIFGGLRSTSFSPVLVLNDKYYLTVDVMTTDSTFYINFGGTNGTVKPAGSGNWEKLTEIIIVSDIAKSYYDTNTAKSSSFVSTSLRKIMAINLTALFGAGNEPDQAWCDLNIPAWFDGTLGGGVIGSIGGLK